MEALGPILLVLSIPLMLRWVPPNRIYGFRVPATCADRSIWYDANALNGRHLFLLGATMIALEFVLPVAVRIGVLRAVAVAGLAVIVIADWRTANRWRDERARQQQTMTNTDGCLRADRSRPGSTAHAQSRK